MMAKIVLSSTTLESRGQKRETEAVGRDETAQGVDGGRGKSLPNIYGETGEKLTRDREGEGQKGKGAVGQC